VTQRARAEEGATMEWVDGNIVNSQLGYLGFIIRRILDRRTRGRRLRAA
jgi:hypothetical protein